MDFSSNKKKGVIIFKLKGNLVGEHDGMPLTDAFSEYTLEGSKNFLIELSELKHINSSGLGVFITLLTRVRNKGGDLVLVAPSENLKKIMLITKLNSIFRTFGTVDEGIAFFKPE